MVIVDKTNLVNLETNQVYVTSQNHGYGIKPESLEKSDFKLWFANADDDTVEGIKHKTKNCIAVQFHPEEKLRRVLLIVNMFLTN